MTLTAEREEELKSLLMEVKEESEKAALKLNIQKLRSWLQSHHFMANRWETMEIVTDFIFLDSKITADGTAAMKLKNACSFEEKL